MSAITNAILITAGNGSNLSLGMAIRRRDTRPARDFLKCNLLCAEVYTKHLYMKTAKLFKNGQSQAVRLPKDFRFEGDEVFIKKVGSSVVLMPEKNSWDALVTSLDKFTPEFMADRAQPRNKDKRESWD